MDRMTRFENTLDETLGRNATCSIYASWENKLMRDDLITAQTKIAQLQMEIQRQNKIQAELELKFEAKEKALESEKNLFKNRATELERMLKKIRKNDDLLENLTSENTSLKAQLCNAQDELQSLRMLNADMQIKLCELEALTTKIDQEKEREVQRLKNLRKSVSKKLLFDEGQVHSLQTRLEKYEQSSVNQATLKSQIESLEKELKEWKSLGLHLVQKGAVNNPLNVRTYVESLMQRYLLLTSEKSSVSSEKMVDEATLKKTKKLEKALEEYRSLLMKFQKKMKLIQGERDRLRQVLENYEKDLTVTLCL